MWQRCQEILDGRHERKHRKVRHDFAFSGLLKCGHCGCSLVGELKKGRYVYYHCTGYRGKCPEPYTREEKLANRFAVQLRALVIPSTVLEWVREAIVASDVTERSARAQTVHRYEMELDRLQGRLDVLYDDRLDGRIDVITYDKKAEEIRGNQQRVRTKITQCQPSGLAPATKAVDLMSLTSKAADRAPMRERTASPASACSAGSDLAERGVADVLPGAVRAIATIERCNHNKRRTLLGKRG